MVCHRKVEPSPPPPEEPVAANQGIFGEYLKSISSISDAYWRSRKCENALSLAKRTPGMFSAQQERELMVLYIQTINRISDAYQRTSQMESAIEFVAKRPDLKDVIINNGTVAAGQGNETPGTVCETITSYLGTLTTGDSFFGLLLVMVCFLFPLAMICLVSAAKICSWILHG